MSSSLQRFRSYEIAEDPAGGSLELWRTDCEIVCLASQPAEQRWVELHVLVGADPQDPSSGATLDEFRTRVQAFQRLRDRRVLELLEAGEDEGALFYVSEFVDGESLDGYLARTTPLPAWWAVEIARQLTLGLLALRGVPSLLARAQIFNARLVMQGEATSDALVKLADFDLGGPPDAAPPATAAAELQSVKEVGRLLCYALSGLVAEQITAPQLTSLPLPPEVIDLLARVLARPGRSSIADLRGLRAALAACALSPSLAAAPARLPATLRPRLTLAAHFPTLPRLATELGERLRLERAPFDAAQPYAQRAFAGAVSVTIQLLPPARLATPAYLPLIRQAAEQGGSRASPHLLRILESPATTDPGWFLEEGMPRLTLDSVRRLRPTLTPAEAAFLLREFDQAVRAVEALGLPPVAMCPQEVFLEFEDSLDGGSGDDQLAAHPVYAWPSFKVKLRAHPTAVHLAQPSRFLREHLLDPCPARPASEPPAGPPAGLGSPSAADYAALFIWMGGGLSTVPAELATLVTGALDGTTVVARTALVDALGPLIPKPAQPPPSTSKGSPPPPTPTATDSSVSKSSRKGRRSKNRGPTTPATKPSAAATKSAGVPAPSPDPVLPTPPPPSRPVAASAAVPATTDSLSFPFGHTSAWEDDGGAETNGAEGGFAEVLLGSAPGSTQFAPRFIEPVLPTDCHEPEQPVEDLPVGALFGAWAGNDPDDGAPKAAEDRAFDFSSPMDLNRGPGLMRLVVLVVLVALLIAVLMAHFTGLAPWR